MIDAIMEHMVKVMINSQCSMDQRFQEDCLNKTPAAERSIQSATAAASDLDQRSQETYGFTCR